MPTNNAWNSEDPAQVAKGGTGNASLTDHGVLLGSGTAAVTVTSPGTDGQVLIGGTGVDPAFSTLTSSGGTIVFTPGVNSLNLESVGGGAVLKVTQFNSSDTWTKDAATSYVAVVGWNGGSGGGSGRRGTDMASSGGGGGGAGGGFYFEAPANFFGATETVTIGAGGPGGAAITTDDTNGNGGNAGGTTMFGSIGITQSQISGGSASYGGGGDTGSGAAGSSQQFWISSDFIGTSYANTGAGTGSTQVGATPQSLGFGISSPISFMPTPGGGGSGADSGTAWAAGVGGSICLWDDQNSILLAGGTAGIDDGSPIDGGNGAAGLLTGGRVLGGTGGGAGAGQTISARGGNGGNGGFPAGGGGGGGGSVNGSDSGAGGAGGDGLVIVIEYT